MLTSPIGSVISGSKYQAYWCLPVIYFLLQDGMLLFTKKCAVKLTFSALSHEWAVGLV